MANNLKDRKPGNVVTLDPKHNQTQDQKDAARSATLIKRLHELRQSNTACDLSKAAHKENTDARTEVYRFMKAELGLTRAQVDDYLTKMGENARELARQEEIRQKDYATLNLPTGSQLKLFADPEKRDAEFWRVQGYKSGLAFGLRSVPADCKDPAMSQEYLAGFDDGSTALNNSLAEDKPVDATVDTPQDEAI